ncbi:aminomethyl-transferring glycine dehydrogenase subunit GcvPA [Clostridiaceae bacterium 35-E11]
MPSSVPETKKEMLKELNVKKIEDLYKDVIPEHLRFEGEMNLPDPIFSEVELKKHVEKILAKNTSCNDFINFLGAGCYQHHVPAVCDEINSRSEFLTAYCGDTYSDHGKMQAIFEYCSMMAELVDMDVVSYTNYDGGQATASSLRMALRITGRREIILPKTMHPEVLSQVKDYCKHVADITFVAYDLATGQIDLNDLKNKVSERTAAIYFENPSYFGIIEEKGQEIADIAHEFGALCIVSADPSSLGILESPANYGADIVCGDIQPLGMHMHYGGGCAGYIATPQEKKFIQEIPTYLYGITNTKVAGEYGWGRALNERCSHGSREDANEYFGTECGLWAITAGVYLALMGPQGMKELGETIIHRSNYARKLLSEIDGVKTEVFKSNHFKEFIVNFDQTGKTVAEINRKLLVYQIFGGKDLSKDFPQLGNSALYCITEVIGIEEIKKMVNALKEILRG